MEMDSTHTINAANSVITELCGAKTRMPQRPTSRARRNTAQHTPSTAYGFHGEWRAMS